MSDALPPPTPEGELIRRAREAVIPRLSIRTASTRIGMSFEHWGAVERGYQSTGKGKPVRRTEATGVTLAQMAWVVNVAPEELEAVGRPDAAEVLREIRRRTPEPPKKRSAELADEYFRDTSIPLEKRREDAARFLEVLSYLLRGEEPPPPQPESGSKPQARPDRNSM